MAVQNGNYRASYDGNGVTTVFVVPFYFLDKAHLLVERHTLATNLVETLVLDSDYTVTGVGVEAGGSIVTVSAPISGQRIVILRNVPFTQLTEYQDGDPFLASSHEQALDKLTMQNQQMKEILDRAAVLPSAVASLTPMPIPTNGGILGWANGAWAWLSGAPVALATNLLTMLRGYGADLVGYLAPFTGAVGRLLHLKLSDVVSIKDFGAVGDGVWTGTPGATASTATGTDDTAAFTAAIASGAKKFRLPAGTYILAGGFQIPSYLEFEGDGMERTFLYHKGGSENVLFANAGGSGAGNIGVKFSGVTIHGNAFRDAGHAPANPTGNVNNQCFNWNTGSGANIPALTLKNVRITSFSGDVTRNVANYIEGSVWVEFDNVYIMDNMYPAGLMLKCSDSIIKGLYASGNGGWGALPNLIIQMGGDNRFLGCYFGGGGCVNQVKVEGGSFNQFIGCTNDNTYGACYLFTDFIDVPGGGTHYGASSNTIIGGSATNADQANTGTYSHIAFEGLASNNIVIGTKIANTTGIKAKYGVSEKAGGTGTNNLLSNCFFGPASSFTTGQASLRAGSGSKILESIGYRGVGFIGASASTASAQALNNGSRTIINFDTVDYDTNSAITTGAAWKFTAPVAGVYEFVGCVGLTGMSSSASFIEVFKNGSAAERPVEHAINLGSAYNEPFSGSLLLAAGDYIDFQVMVFNAGATLRSSAKYSWVKIRRAANS